MHFHVKIGDCRSSRPFLIKSPEIFWKLERVRVYAQLQCRPSTSNFSKSELNYVFFLEIFRIAILQNDLAEV